jgi:hypothetical protein
MLMERRLTCRFIPVIPQNECAVSMAVHGFSGLER